MAKRAEIKTDDLHFVMSHPEAVAREMAKQTQRIEELEAKLAQAVEAEMSRVCNEYAKEGNMVAATAVHDTWLCVKATLAAITAPK